MELIVKSPSIIDGWFSNINSGYGLDYSPEINIEGITEKGTSLVLTLDDLGHPIFPGFNHYVAWNISICNTIPANIPHGAIVDDPIHVVQGIAYGKHCYRGPKPPFNWNHQYVFTIYVIDIMLDISPNSKKKDVLKAIDGHILQKGFLYGNYQRKRK